MIRHVSSWYLRWYKVSDKALAIFLSNIEKNREHDAEKGVLIKIYPIKGEDKKIKANYEYFAQKPKTEQELLQYLQSCKLLKNSNRRMLQRLKHLKKTKVTQWWVEFGGHTLKGNLWAEAREKGIYSLSLEFQICQNEEYWSWSAKIQRQIPMT